MKKLDNFTYWNPTKLIFGKGQLESLTTEIPQYGKKVLFVYGGGSIKKAVYTIKRSELLNKLVQKFLS